MKNIKNYAIQRSDKGVCIQLNLEEQVKAMKSQNKSEFESNFKYLLNQLEEKEFLTHENYCELIKLFMNFMAGQNQDSYLKIDLTNPCFIVGIKIAGNTIEIHLRNLEASNIIAGITAIFHQANIQEIDENPAGYAFYRNQGGNQILKAKNYPEGISHYLNEEFKKIDTFIKEKKGKYTSILEIGCGKMRNVNLALEKGLKYYGIDFVNKYIEKSQKMIDDQGLQDKCFVKCMSALDFNKETNFIPKEERPLCIFPFNVLGNIGNVFDILTIFNKFKYDVIISTYKTDDDATNIRNDYFVKCHYSNIKIEKTNSGTVFTSDEGLKSIAFDSSYLLNLSAAANYNVVKGEFGGIGMMYTLFSNTPRQRLFEQYSKQANDRYVDVSQGNSACMKR